jgi:hypothetical protein
MSILVGLFLLFKQLLILQIFKEHSSFQQELKKKGCPASHLIKICHSTFLTQI